MQTIRIDAKYGTQTTITFVLRTKSATDSDTYYDSTAPLASECKIYHDGVAYNSGNGTTNAPSLVTGGLWTLVLTASELSNADVVDLVIKSATTLWRDQHIQIRTKWKIGQFDIDASQITNGDAMKLTGNGSGKSINANKDLYTAAQLQIGSNLAVGGDFAVTGNLTAAAMSLTGALAVGSNLTVGGAMTVTGILSASAINGVLSSMVLRSSTLPDQTGMSSTQVKLDTGASATADYYKTAIIMMVTGTSAGQSRVINAYSTGRVATINRAWSTQPVSGDTFILLPGNDVWNYVQVELADGTALVSGPSVGTAIQALYQRFFFKRTQTAAVQTLYKADAATVLDTCAVDDDGTTETVGSYV